MTRTIRIAALAIAALATATAGGGLLAAQKPYRIAAAERDAEGEWLPKADHSALSRGVAVHLKYLEHEAARATIEKGLSRPIDLLPARRDEKRPGFLVFVLQIDNHGEEPIQFNPGQARFATEKGDMKFALDYTALYEVARRFGPAGPTIDEMAAIFFERAIPIAPGGSVRKLLAFHAPTEDRWKTAEVMVVEIQSGADAVDLKFLFRKFEPAVVEAMEAK